MEYVEIIEDFIDAERTSNWCLHLQSCSRMLNLLAASGNSNYAKSLRIYLQDMTGLRETNPKLYTFFKEGRHTARRSEHKWSGIWTDLCIEQTLMRAVKTQGGLIGRGMSDSVRNLWVLSMINTAVIHEALAYPQKVFIQRPAYRTWKISKDRKSVV